ncbi:MAG: ATP-binding cassette domain-containing protein [Spirulina sp. DLM2.Bin59]|nr:MAG: ATP-binding cassette domain-containing protein [Spirulina sp. DLM2.Bin59]
MIKFLEIDHVDRVFPLANGGRYVALKNINLTINQGEFISLLGHSGCGKSTLLNILAGLDRPTTGGIILAGREVRKPGPDRMVVFQNYSLLPWKTVRENIALGVDEVLAHLPKGERQAIIAESMRMVKLDRAADKRPGELSGGMKQRVAIARALALRPKVLLLDEPFGALDALTRGSLQEQLMQICQESGVTCVMVTHDADEALLLSDRIVLLTNGPAAHVGQILTVPFPRPRNRHDVINHPRYYALRGEIIYFLEQQKLAKKRPVRQAPAIIAGNGLEKVNLDLGFIPLTDCAPLVVAKEKGLFERHGLTQVNLSREPSWNAIAAGLREQRLDGAQVVAGLPLAMTLGYNGKPPIPIVTALTLSRNGNAITLGQKYLEMGVRSLPDLKALIETKRSDAHSSGQPYQPLKLATVHPASMHNLMLRYWLASAGIDPDYDVEISIVPPPQMVSNLRSGNIDGYCVGEPWNTVAVQENIGYVIATDLEIWPSHIEKVMAVREDWATQYPQTHLALVQALLEACEYCDDRRNRDEIAELLSRPEYVGIEPQYLRPGFIDPYDRGMGEEPKMLLTYNTFAIDKANCPDRVEALWILAQMARWEITPFPRNWITVIDRVRRVDVYSEAAEKAGFAGLEPNRNAIQLFDGSLFNPDDPLAYLEGLAIKREIHVEKIDLDAPVASLA